LESAKDPVIKFAHSGYRSQAAPSVNYRACRARDSFSPGSPEYAAVNCNTRTQQSFPREKGERPSRARQQLPCDSCPGCAKYGPGEPIPGRAPANPHERDRNRSRLAAPNCARSSAHAEPGGHPGHRPRSPGRTAREPRTPSSPRWPSSLGYLMTSGMIHPLQGLEPPRFPGVVLVCCSRLPAFCGARRI
jgi:hypothetical protein